MMTVIRKERGRVYSCGTQLMAVPSRWQGRKVRSLWTEGYLWYAHVEEGSILTQPEESRVGNYLGQVGLYACGWVGLDC